MTVPGPYLQGLLAAVRPEEQRAERQPEPAAASALEATTAASALPGEECSWQERIKRHLHPLDAYSRLLDCAASNHPPTPDDRFRFEWLGLFYQAPEQDSFTLRVRLPGGRIKPFQLAGLAHITQRHAGGQVLFNSHGGLDIPSVPITSAAEILAHVESIGLSSIRTGGDCVQTIRGGELECAATVGGDKTATIYPLIRELEHALAYGPTFSDLPLPCEIVFEQADDLAVVRPEPGVDTIFLRVPAPGADLTLEEARTGTREFVLHLPGGGSSDFLIPYERVVISCLQMLRGWAAGAERSGRETAGLAKFLAGLGPERICELVGGTIRVSREPQPALEAVSRTSQAPPGFVPPAGRLLSGQLTALERCCEEQAWQEIRVYQKHLHAVGVDGRISESTEIMHQLLSF